MIPEITKNKIWKSTKKIKTYVYAAQMSFIDSSIALAPAEASPFASQTPTPEVDSDEAE